MKVEEIRIGDRYCHFFGEIVEVTDITGRSRPRVHCFGVKNKREKIISPAELTAIEDYQAEMERKARQLQENRRKTQEIKAVAGEGAVIDGKVLHNEVRLLFTEQAAIRLLQACGGNLPRQDQLPSTAQSSGEYVKRTQTLSRKLRRALKAGYVGDFEGSFLYQNGAKHQATVLLQEDDFDTVMQTIYGLEPEEPSKVSSALTSLV